MGSMKNMTTVGIMRGPDTNAKTFTIKCIFCNHTIPLRRKDSAKSISVSLGISNTQWEHADNAHAGGGDYGKDWEALYQQHIESHSAGEMIAVIHKLEDALANYQATISHLNDFLDEFVKDAAASRVSGLMAIFRRLKRIPHVDIPEQIDNLIALGGKVDPSDDDSL